MSKLPDRCRVMAYGYWKLDHGRPGHAACMKPKGHEGSHDADYDPQVEERIRHIGSEEDRKDFQTYYFKNVPVEEEWTPTYEKVEGGLHIGPVKVEVEGKRYIPAYQYDNAVLAHQEAMQEMHDRLRGGKEEYRMLETELRDLRGELEEAYADIDAQIDMKLEARDALLHAKEELKSMTARKDDYVDALQACHVQLHDQKQHELGTQCAELQDRVDELEAEAKRAIERLEKCQRKGWAKQVGRAIIGLEKVLGIKQEWDNPHND